MGVHIEVWWVPFTVYYFLFKSIWPWCAKEKNELMFSQLFSHAFLKDAIQLCLKNNRFIIYVLG